MAVIAAISTLTNPAASATTVDFQGTTFSVDTLGHFSVGPGLTQSHLVFSASSFHFDAYVLDMNVAEAKNMRIKVDVGRDSCNTAEAITSIAKRKTTPDTQYLAGINGDFFITSSFANQHEFGNAILGYPNMSCITGGKIVAPDMIDITSRENALIVGSEGMWIDATDLKYRLLDNSGDIIVDAKAVNYPRRDEEMVVYNSYMGKYTKTSPQGREIVLRPADGAKWRVNKTVKFVVDSDWHPGQSLIPEDGIVISCGPKYTNDFIDGLKKGDIVKLKIVLSLPAFNKLKPDVLEVCGGDVRILKENVTTTEAIRWINTPSSRYSRSLVGYSKDRDHVVMCAVDAGNGSSGVTYFEAADLMRYLGCWDALDLDGGGSTAIWSHSHGIFNNLRDGSERAVGNGLFFVLDAPKSTEVKSIRFADHTITLPRYGKYQPVIYGYNEHGQLIDLDIKDFTLEAPEGLGDVIDNGSALLASGNGTHLLRARKGDLTADIVVNVDGAVTAAPRVKKYLLNTYRPFEIELQATVGDKIMKVAAEAYTWSVADASVASVDNHGILTGIKNGTTVVTGILGDSKIELPVTVERPEAKSIEIVDKWNPDEWTFALTGIKPATMTTDENGGATIDYKVTSTRGTSLTIKNQQPIYSLPDGFTVELGQDAGQIESLTLNILPANAKNVAIKSTTAPAPGKTEKITFDLASHLDLNDPAIYPLTFSSLQIYAPKKTGTYKLKINSLASTYSYVNLGNVDNITVPDVTAEKLICSVDGNTVSLPFTADRIDIFNAAGAIETNAVNTNTVSLPSAGFYIIRAVLGTKTLSTRVIIK